MFLPAHSYLAIKRGPEMLMANIAYAPNKRCQNLLASLPQISLRVYGMYMYLGKS